MSTLDKMKDLTPKTRKEAHYVLVESRMNKIWSAILFGLAAGALMCACSTSVQGANMAQRYPSDRGLNGDKTERASGKIASKNMCNYDYLALEHTPENIEYAKTGKSTGVKNPGHSRGVYLAAFGMRPLLRAFLETHPKAMNDPDILSAGVYSGQKDVVAMLLEMGFDPNSYSKEALAPPLFYAASCGRPTIMAYLILAGADVYGRPSDGGSFAMAYALVGAGLDGKPFAQGVRLLLAAGFDPRCPVAKNGRTSMDVAKRGLQYDRKYAPNVAKDERKLIDLLKSATKISARKHPGRPDCGGTNWWRN